MKAEIIKVQDLVVAYGENRIINGLNLSIKQGEFMGIIGPNGTGKSTLVKAITNILESKAGSIRIRERDHKTLSQRELAKLVAVVPQDFNIEYDFTNLDIVMMGRNPHIDRKHKIGQRDYDIAKEAMMMTSTWQFKDRLFNELSGGERQRVIIARAIAQQSEIILLDEPTSHLDIHHQLEIMELISALREKRGLTIVAVLHDVNMAARFCDNIILLDQGRVLTQGHPDEVIREENLSKLYNMEMIVRENRIIGKREIVPLRVIKDTTSRRDIRVHVICGGGSGDKILERLNSHGINVSAGIINQGDSDWEVCSILNIPCVDAPPFSAFTQEEGEQLHDFLEHSDYVLITQVPFGRGNLKNLEVLQSINKPIFFIKSQGNIDFCDGQALALISELEGRGNFHYVKDYDEFLQSLS